MESKVFRESISEAKERFADDKKVMEVLEEMEADPSLDSVVDGTILTVILCKE